MRKIKNKKIREKAGGRWLNWQGGGPERRGPDKKAERGLNIGYMQAKRPFLSKKNGKNGKNGKIQA